MASSVFVASKSYFMDGTVDLNTHDIRAILLDVTTTADTETGDGTIVTVDGISTLGESADTLYSRVIITGEAVVIDDPNDRGEFTSDPIVFILNGDHGTNYQGMLLYKHVTDDTNSIPIAFIEFDNQPISSTATQITATAPSATGWITIT